MKNALVAAVVIGLMTATASAQMGGGMGSMMEDQKGSMPHGQTMPQSGMMDPGQMMGSMMSMSDQMSQTMGRMSGIMKEMPAGNMPAMSGIMKNLSQQMLEMSTLMGKGSVSAEDMKRMQDRMADI